MHLGLEIGEHANDYETIAKKEKLNALETRLYQLVSQVKDISNEQSYQRHREATFREISVSTNNRVVYWSLIQVRPCHAHVGVCVPVGLFVCFEGLLS